ncbi:MAG: hypothetical protein JSV29_05285, partial [Candidatus Bathyarchaeota archaeon]
MPIGTSVPVSVSDIRPSWEWLDPLLFAVFFFSRRVVFFLGVASFFFLAGDCVGIFLDAPLSPDKPVPFRFTTFFFFFFVLGIFSS